MSPDLRQPHPFELNQTEKQRLAAMRDWAGEPPEPELTPKDRAIIRTFEALELIWVIVAMFGVYMFAHLWFDPHVAQPFGDLLSSLRWSKDIPFIISVR